MLKDLIKIAAALIIAASSLMANADTAPYRTSGLEVHEARVVTTWVIGGSTFMDLEYATTYGEPERVNVELTYPLTYNDGMSILLVVDRDTELSCLIVDEPNEDCFETVDFVNPKQ